MNTVFPEIVVSADDRQVGGSHYKDMPMQPWDVMQAVLTPEEFRGYDFGASFGRHRHTLRHGF